MTALSPECPHSCPDTFRTARGGARNLCPRAPTYRPATGAGDAQVSSGLGLSPAVLLSGFQL